MDELSLNDSGSVLELLKELITTDTPEYTSGKEKFGYREEVISIQWRFQSDQAGVSISTQMGLSLLWVHMESIMDLAMQGYIIGTENPGYKEDLTSLKKKISASISLSASGHVIAVGAFDNDGYGQEDSGVVRVYKYNISCEEASMSPSVKPSKIPSQSPRPTKSAKQSRVLFPTFALAFLRICFMYGVTTSILIIVNGIVSVAPHLT